jgi:hypothetical protein
MKRGKPGSHPATIHDVAAAAGVSVKTVSRVINREPNVRDEVRGRVEATVRELHYHSGSRQAFYYGPECSSSVPAQDHLRRRSSSPQLSERENERPVLALPFPLPRWLQPCCRASWLPMHERREQHKGRDQAGLVLVL